jgi:diguanylate cyclase (GGDEF)-like protein
MDRISDEQLGSMPYEKLLAYARNLGAYVSQLEVEHATDSLTGVRSRAEFESRIKPEINNFIASINGDIDRRRGFPKQMLFGYVDLNGLKQINDTQGHSAGDVYIAAVAQSLTDSVRATDTVIRLGGDEFGVVLRLDTHDPIIADATIRQVLALSRRQTHQLLDSPTASFAAGFVNVGDGYANVDEVLQAADLAMYENKQAQKLAPVDNE